MDDVGIIGAGYSALTLGLRLQQLGVGTTLYAEATPDAMRAARLPNTVGRFAPTLARERALGIEGPPDPDDHIAGLQFRAGPPLDVAYEGHFSRSPRATDFRVLLPDMLEEYDARGGHVVIAPDVDAVEVERLAAVHDLVVVAVGRRSISALFPVDVRRSPHRRPQRLVFAGLFDGLRRPDHGSVSLNVAPGVGEVVQMPMRTADGPGTSILIDAVPDGPLAAVATMPADDERFGPTLLEALRHHAPAIAGRADPDRFAVSGPHDWLHGALTPTVRHGWRELSRGTIALAIGDAWITNDPITAQGANLASHCAWVAADHIARGGPYDAAFAQQLEDAMWEHAGPVTAFTNAFLRPPPPHVVELVFAAATHQAVADRYVDLFADPAAMWQTVSAPDGVARFIGESADAPGAHAASS